MCNRPIFRDEEKSLASWLAARPPGLVVFDGLPGAGKTTLAQILASSSGSPAIDAEQLQNEKPGVFLQGLRIADLTTAIGSAMARVPRVLLSTGGRQVVQRIGIEVTAFVYVLLLTPAGELDKKYLDLEDDFDRGNRPPTGFAGSTWRPASTIGFASPDETQTPYLHSGARLSARATAQRRADDHRDGRAADAAPEGIALQDRTHPGVQPER